MLTAGELTNKIDLERDVVSRLRGVESRAPQTYASGVWAKAEPLSGREYWNSQQVASEISWKFTIRYRADVLVSDRVVFGGKKYEIKAVQPDTAHRDSVILMCKGA